MHNNYYHLKSSVYMICIRYYQRWKSQDSSNGKSVVNRYIERGEWNEEIDI